MKGLFGAIAALAASFAAGSAGAQDYSLSPSFGTVSLTYNFQPDPIVIEVTAGGTVAAERLGSSGCIGTIGDAPDFRLHYQAGNLPLFISAISQEDVTLVVNLPDGRWVCNDDYRGTDPGLVFRRPMSGQYDIWIGHFGRGSRVPAKLRISEIVR